MEDQEIIALFFDRSERAAAAAQEKYGSFCRCIARSILLNEEDARECENDTYLHLWNAIPPQRPENLKAYMAKTTRNLALQRLEKQNTAKRKGLVLPLDALSELLAANETVEQQIDAKLLAQALNRFLEALPTQQRLAFVGRYWYCQSISDIAVKLGASQSKVKMLLFRVRQKLKQYLLKEGYEL